MDFAEKKIEYHPLEPFIPNGARVLLLGSFPPPRGRWSMDFFYPNFLNDMWRIMGLVFHGDRQYFTEGRKFRQAAIEEMLTRHGIGVYDTARAVRRLKDNASDKFLEIVEPTDISLLLRAHPTLVAVAATGEKAAQTLAERFGTAVPRTGECLQTVCDGRSVAFYRMPSSSRAYPLPLDRKAEAYRRMFKAVGIV